jgi:hypothetical protein
MPLIKEVILCTIILVLLASCMPGNHIDLSTETPQTNPEASVETDAVIISQVIYSQRPIGGGFVSLEINADGELISRLAHAETPSEISLDKAHISQEDIDTIWESAYRVWQKPPEGDFFLPETGEGYNEITILTKNQRQMSLFWRCDEKHADKRINFLATLLEAYLPGGL